VAQRRGRLVDDAVAGLPRAQAPVDVLVGHRVALVAHADLVDLVEDLARDVHARAGDRQRRATTFDGPWLCGLKR
jgi:hypothetical protein